MTDEAESRLTDLEDFLYGDLEQPQEEVVADLRAAGIDTRHAAMRIEQLVQQKRDAYLRRQVEQDQDLEESGFPHFDDFSTMPREMLLASFEELSENVAHNEDSSEMSDEDLRSWLMALSRQERRNGKEK